LVNNKRDGGESLKEKERLAFLTATSL